MVVKAGAFFRMHRYSSRSAVIGSTREARRAGRYAASIVTASTAGVTTKYAASGESPGKVERSARATPALSINPAPIPDNASANP